MFLWQINALRLEESALASLDGVIADYAPYAFVGFVYVLIPFSIWALSGGLRRKLLKGKPMPHIQPGVVIRFPIGRPSPKQEPVAPFPPYREPSHYECDGDDRDLD
jgi:hypothetical protein